MVIASAVRERRGTLHSVPFLLHQSRPPAHGTMPSLLSSDISWHLWTESSQILPAMLVHGDSAARPSDNNDALSRSVSQPAAVWTGQGTWHRWASSFQPCAGSTTVPVFLRWRNAQHSGIPRGKPAVTALPMIYNFMRTWKQQALSRKKNTLNFEFGPFPELTIYKMTDALLTVDSCSSQSSAMVGFAGRMSPGIGVISAFLLTFLN